MRLLTALGGPSKSAACTRRCSEQRPSTAFWCLSARGRRTGLGLQPIRGSEIRQKVARCSAASYCPCCACCPCMVAASYEDIVMGDRSDSCCSRDKKDTKMRVGSFR